MFLKPASLCREVGDAVKSKCGFGQRYKSLVEIFSNNSSSVSHIFVRFEWTLLLNILKSSGICFRTKFLIILLANQISIYFFKGISKEGMLWCHGFSFLTGRHA